MRKAFTLIELLVAIVIMAILAVGFTKVIHLLYVKKAQAKYVTKFSFESQLLLDQVSELLSKRVHYTTIAYDPDCNDTAPSPGYFEGIDQNMSSIICTTHSSDPTNKVFAAKILEWYSFAYDARMRDAYQSYVIDWRFSDGSEINLTKFDSAEFSAIEGAFSEYTNINQLAVLVPPKTGDDVDSLSRKLGWHEPVTTINKELIKNVNGLIAADKVLQFDVNDTFRYNSPTEKVYLLSSAYAIALGAHIDKTTLVASCGPLTALKNEIAGMDMTTFNSTLFLFRGYRPWRGETFCMDKNIPSGGTRAGLVTMIAKNVSGFSVQSIEHNLVFKVTMEKDLRGSDVNITFNKQKVIF